MPRDNEDRRAAEALKTALSRTAGADELSSVDSTDDTVDALDPPTRT